ncbi:MAG: NAD+ synthase [Patescibacteria group bacterium]
MQSIDPKRVAEQMMVFIKNAFNKERHANAVIGLSGGIDSATSCALVTRALGANHVYPVLLPYGSLSNEGTKDARLVIDWLKIPEKQVRVIDIQPMVDAGVNTIDSAMDEGRRGNIMARMRMVVLYDLAKAMPALVIGTENKTEHLLGYYTKFGDEASDIEPLRHLYKTQVYELARYLDVPEKILSKPPTAGLWEDQTDEGEFGFTYKEVDEVLFLHFDQHVSKEAIIKRGYNKKTIERMWWWIEKGRFKDRLPVILQER